MPRTDYSWGKRQSGKVKKYCKMWHNKKGFSYIVIKNAGHNANVDNPDEMNRVMEEFINKEVI